MVGVTLEILRIVFLLVTISDTVDLVACIQAIYCRSKINVIFHLLRALFVPSLVFLPSSESLAISTISTIFQSTAELSVIFWARSL